MALLPDKKHALVIVRYGYVIIDRHERRPAEELTLFRVEGHSVTGKPTIYGNTLYTADRLYGHVRITDITDIEHPKLIDSLELSGNPGFIVEHNGTPIIPAGYQGLLVLNNKPRG